MHFALFVMALLWAAAANVIGERAAHGLAVRFGLSSLQGLLANCFLLFLAVLGFRVLDGMATRGAFLRDALPLPRRASAGQEWGTGAAIGWGICLAAVLPLLVSGNLHGRVDLHLNVISGALLAMLSLLVGALAQETIFRGFALRRLSAAIGEATGAVAMSLLFAALLVGANPPHSVLTGLVDGTLFGLLLAMAWMRTHGLWLGWGLNFGYRAVAAVALGLPIAGRGEFGSPTEMYATGPRWLTGGAFGLDAAVWTALVMVAAMAVLYRVSRDWAWVYTARPIVAGGYEVVVAPPAAHVAMEKAAAPPPLVQILPVTPQGNGPIGSVPPPPKPVE
jgi:membrane protease YdiL (CAAX protease family)